MARLNGVVSVWSNSPYQPTGYGVQAGFLVDRLKRDGADVAALSNYGIEGNVSTLQTPHGVIPHYSRGFEPYSNDVAPMDHAHHRAIAGKNKKDLFLTLYDVWVLKGKAWDAMRQIASWVPLDHVTMPPNVEKWLRKPNVHPIAMAPHGVRQMSDKGIECDYVPHAIDTGVMKPTFEINGKKTRKVFSIPEDVFVVGMVAANKASGMVHRKAFSENILAFSIFHKKYPDSRLYLHTDPVGAAGGWNLMKLCEAAGIPKESVLFANPADLRYGFTQTHMAAIYSMMDVMLATSYGEGFGVPTVEAQATGTRVIGSDWAATPDLVAPDCYLVDGQPTYDAGQESWWQIPSVPSIVNALEMAYAADRGRSQVCVDFVKQFDVETVWESHWIPVLQKLLA